MHRRHDKIETYDNAKAPTMIELETRRLEYLTSQMQSVVVVSIQR